MLVCYTCGEEANDDDYWDEGTDYPGGWFAVTRYYSRYDPGCVIRDEVGFCSLTCFQKYVAADCPEDPNWNDENDETKVP